jgi:outer membrane protein TolC
VVSAQIRLSDDLTDLEERQAELRRAQLALRDVLGLPLGDLVVPSESRVPFRPIGFRVGTWVERALRDRPEILELRTRLEQSQLQVRVSKNDVLPRLDALGLYRRSDDDSKLSRALDLGSELWRAGLEFEIPFGNVAARERLATARVEYARVERELERTRREIETEVRNEVIDLRRNLATVTIQADKVERSQEKLEVAIARYRLGIANNLDVTDAQTDLRDAETDLLTALFDYTKGLARLEASIAGPI